MWQEKLGPLLEGGKLKVVGIVQEQHPARARLYAQWKKIDWPILVDSLNLMNLRVVPVIMGLDENGRIVRDEMRPADVDAFLAEPPVNVERSAQSTRPKGRKSSPYDRGSGALPEAMPLRVGAEAFLMGQAGSKEKYAEAVAAFERAVARNPNSGTAWFRLGVALRAMHENAVEPIGGREEGRRSSAQAAADAWFRGLEREPNQYIWRRRLQQYGPRLRKPYDFYTWVKQAREEISKRGEIPVALSIEPAGGEILARRKDQGWQTATGESKEGESRIARDKVPLVTCRAIVVPPRVRPGGFVRVRVLMKPESGANAHWNNEARNMCLRVDIPTGAVLGEASLEYPNPSATESSEQRLVEFELQIGADTPRGDLKFLTYALYYVCEGDSGKCRYLRQDIPVKLVVDPDAPEL